MVLPTGTTVPPLPYVALLVGGLAIVVTVLYRRNPPITATTILALSPWMVAGAATYVTYQLERVPEPFAPFASSPAVYGTAAILAGTTWVIATEYTAIPHRLLAVTGVLATIPATTVAVLASDHLTPVIPLISLVAATVVTGLYWRIGPTAVDAVATTGSAGTLVVFGQALDGFTTTLGIAHLGFAEQTPLSRLLIEATANYPLPLLGSGWLFLLVKLALGFGVVWLLAPTVDRSPRDGYLLLGLVAAVGLGPGTHNALLFTVTTP